MLEFWLVTISALITGSCVIYIIYLTVWFARRPSVMREEQINRMDKQLTKISLDLIGLKARVEWLGERMDDYRKDATRFDRRVSELESAMRQVQWKTNREKSNKIWFQSDTRRTRNAIDDIQDAIRDHQKFLDKEIASLRERIGRNGAG